MSGEKKSAPRIVAIAIVVLAPLATLALGYPDQRERALRYLDRVIDDTLRIPWRNFLLPDGHQRPFVRQPATSIMVDGEISLMIGLRRMIRDDGAYAHREEHRRLVERCIAAIEAGPVLCCAGASTSSGAATTLIPSTSSLTSRVAYDWIATSSWSSLIRIRRFGLVSERPERRASG